LHTPLSRTIRTGLIVASVDFSFFAASGKSWRFQSLSLLIIYKSNFSCQDVKKLFSSLIQPIFNKVELLSTAVLSSVGDIISVYLSGKQSSHAD
jgi:hypothetical protein